MDNRPQLFFRVLLATALFAFIPLGLAKIAYQHPIAEWGLWALEHPYLYTAIWICIFAFLLIAGRLGLNLWFNHIFPYLSNTHISKVSYGFAFQEMDFMRELCALRRVEKTKRSQVAL